MCWANLESLNDNPQTWGIKRTHFENSKIMFEGVLKRCGRFLTHLVLDTLEVYSDIVNLVRRECPRLQDIDIINRQSFHNVEILKSIFNKVQKFSCIIVYQDAEGTLKDLLSTNNKLEHLELYFPIEIFSFNFLEVLPQETIKELIIESLNISFNRICRVSLNFQFSTFFLTYVTEPTEK